MSAVERIAFFQNRRDEGPNQELARELAQTQDAPGIREIAENLHHKDSHVRADCLKVLYEIGFLNPGLIALYVSDFLGLLKSKDNRMVWGSMIALSTIAGLRTREIGLHLDDLLATMEQGSVITVDNGIKILALVAANDESYSPVIFPHLLNHLSTCRPKEIPQHSEKSLVAVNASNKESFIAVLENRMTQLTDAQVARVKKVIRAARKIEK